MVKTQTVRPAAPERAQSLGVILVWVFRSSALGFGRAETRAA